MPEVTTQRAQIYFKEKGSGVNTLLFIHGWGINCSYWDDQLEYFSKNYRVVAFDLPGFGKSKSDRTEWTRKNYGQDIIDLIDMLDMKNVILIGHSMSGDVALEAALKGHKEIIGIIGIDNFKTLDVTYTPEQIEEMQESFKAMVNDYKNAVPMFASMLFSHETDSSIKKRVIDDFVNSDEKISIATMYDMIDYFNIEGQRLSELDYKLYLVNCDFLPINTPGLDRYCRKSYEISNISGSGHYPMIEKTEEFNKKLEETICRVIAEGQG